MARRTYSPMPSLRLQLPQRISCIFLLFQRCARMPAPREVARPWPNWQAASAGTGRGRCSNTDHVAASFFPVPASSRRAPCEAPISSDAHCARLTSWSQSMMPCARERRTPYVLSKLHPQQQRSVGKLHRFDLQLERRRVAVIGQVVRDAGDDPAGAVDLWLPPTYHSG